ncbi:MAG: hypothetical protein JNJ73_09920 [Hyphomonadaceae bacterium]|nr:hypothetical protein [Hyphomonadaceae bacterium]
MANETGTKTPVFGAVAAAFATWRATLPRIWTTVVACGALSAGASFATVRFAGGNPLLFFVSQLLVLAVFTYAYTAQSSAALDVPAEPRRRVFDAARVYAALSVIAFFLFIVFVAAMFPGAIILAASVPVEDLQALNAASGDPEAAMQMFSQLFAAHWPQLLIIAALYSAIWMFLTSRFYLAAPATIVERRVLTFETWRWTKGEAWRITAARLLLLGPAQIAISLLQALLLAAFGAGPFSIDAMQSLLQKAPALHLAVLAPLHIVMQLLYWGLEAALSATLYKGLKPANAAP